jgi:hypothetical protein
MSAPDLGAGPFTYGEWIAGAAFVLAVVSFIFTRSESARTEAISDALVKQTTADTRADVEANRVSVEAIKKELADHKLAIAENYVSLPMLERTEERLLGAIKEVVGAVNALGGRLDRILEGASRPPR